jgi:carbon storage regulator CsrA
MLCLSRKVGSKVVMSNGVTVTVLAVKGKAVSLGIDAPKDVRVSRDWLRPPADTPRPAPEEQTL